MRASQTHTVLSRDAVTKYGDESAVAELEL
jgi:hypothetical protein